MPEIIRSESRLDANEIIFFQRELEAIKAKSYDVKYPTLKARELIPLSFEGGPGAKYITYRQFSQVGKASAGGNYMDDAPSADVAGLEFTQQVVPIRSSFSYTIQDIRSASMTNMNLPDKKSKSALRAIAEKEDELAAVGDSAFGFQGLLNNSSITVVNAPLNAGSTSRAWSAKTPDEIIADFGLMDSTIGVASYGDMRADSVVIPIEQDRLLTNTRLTATGETLRSYILGKMGWVKNLSGWHKCDSAGATGDRAIAYIRDPEFVEMRVPMETIIHDPQQKNLAFDVQVEERFGGTVFYYPISAMYLDQI